MGRLTTSCPARLMPRLSFSKLSHSQIISTTQNVQSRSCLVASVTCKPVGPLARAMGYVEAKRGKRSQNFWGGRRASMADMDSSWTPATSRRSANDNASRQYVCIAQSVETHTSPAPNIILSIAEGHAVKQRLRQQLFQAVSSAKRITQRAGPHGRGDSSPWVCS